MSTHIGDARLLLNKNAKTLNGFINKYSDVRTYLHVAINESYKRSKCKNLDSPVSLEVILDVLGETAYQLEKNHTGDLFDIEFLEEIIFLACDYYPDQIQNLVAQQLSTNETNSINKLLESPSHQVTSFLGYKIKRANSRQ